MSHREPSGASTDSHDSESSQALGECFSQPLLPTTNKAMNDAFTALDDSIVDLNPIALQYSSEEIPGTSNISQFPPGSLSVDSFASSYSESSDARSKVYTYCPSPVPESKGRQGTFTQGNDASACIFGHDSLQQKAEGWLHQPSNLTRVESRCVETLQHGNQRPKSTGTAARTCNNKRGHRDSINGNPGTRGFLHHMDLFNDCNCDNHVARSLTKERCAIEKDGPVAGEFEAHTQENLRKVLDDYHTALLHIRSCYRPTNFCTLRYRPSLRRQYPRGLEEEAHQSMELITLRDMVTECILQRRGGRASSTSITSQAAL
ncbi:hypothetical protein ACKAV7_008369 [Fusarium commune]